MRYFWVEKQGKLPKGTLKNQECLGTRRLREGIFSRSVTMTKSFKVEKAEDMNKGEQKVSFGLSS